MNEEERLKLSEEERWRWHEDRRLSGDKAYMNALNAEEHHHKKF